MLRKSVINILGQISNVPMEYLSEVPKQYYLFLSLLVFLKPLFFKGTHLETSSIKPKIRLETTAFTMWLV